jgi:hypothetical protein
MADCTHLEFENGMRNAMRNAMRMAYLLNVLAHIVQVVWPMTVENIYGRVGRWLEEIHYIDRAAAVDHDDGRNLRTQRRIPDMAQMGAASRETL